MLNVAVFVRRLNWALSSVLGASSQNLLRMFFILTFSKQLFFDLKKVQLNVSESASLFRLSTDGQLLDQDEIFGAGAGFSKKTAGVPSFS